MDLLKELDEDNEFYLYAALSKKYNGTLVEKINAVKNIFLSGSSHTINVDRKWLLGTSLNGFTGLSIKVLREEEFEVSFFQEEGIDGGGPYREWASKLMEEMCSSSFFSQTQ